MSPITSRNSSSQISTGNKTQVFTLFILFIFIAVGLGSCRSAGDNKGESTVKFGQGETAAPAASSVQDLWDKQCSACHNLEGLRGKSAQEIQNAVDNVGVMSYLKQMLKPGDVEDLEKFLAGKSESSEAPEQNGGNGTGYEFVASDTCGTCHANHLENWKYSMHALAHSESVYDHYFIRASMDTGQKIETFCASCHTPIAVLNGNIPFPHPVKSPEDTKVSPIEANGVQCDFCHVITKAEGTPPGNADYVTEPSRIKRGPYEDSESTFHDTAFSKLHKDARLCGSCHDVIHPSNGIVLESTYSEWAKGPYAKQGVQCQDCHMTRGLTRAEAQPGVAALGGPQREHVSSHFFVGPNMLFNNIPAAAEIRDLSQKLLKSAARVDIAGVKRTDSGAELSVSVTNTGAGHSIPTGVSEIRQLWLEVKITGAQGSTVFHSGALDPQGNLIQDPEPVLYYTWVKDQNGEFTTLFWNTVEKVRDYRIAPKETKTETFTLPADISGAVTVSVSLQYRSVSPAGLAEAGMPEDAIDIPVFTIHSVKKNMTL